MSVWQNIRFLRAFDKFTASIRKDGSMKSWFMSLLSLAVSAATIFAPEIQNQVAHHPAIFGTIAGIIGVISHILPSPTGAALPPKE